jgi:biopolymer transport protein TolR
MRKRSRMQNEEVSLQITSMADVFVILLVFLLKSAATGLTVSMSQNMTLPKSVTAAETATRLLTVEINESGVYLEGAMKAQFKAGAYPAGASAQAFPELQEGLRELRTKQAFIEKKGGVVTNPSELIVMADKQVPYGIIKRVLLTASLEGYTDAKLAATRD